GFLGIFFGVLAGRSFGKKHGLSESQIATSLALPCVIGMVGAIAFHQVAYQSAGRSLVGSILFALLGMLLASKSERMSFLKCSDLFIFAGVIGAGFGRMGCFLAHDHPGIHTEFFLGVQYPDGGRHDLGLYE